MGAGLSQEELASKAQLSVRAIANIEVGRVRRPHTHSLRKLADALGLSGEEREAFTQRPALPPPAEVPRYQVPASDSLVEIQLSASPGKPVRQLPVDVRPFIGRKDECRAISDHLRPKSITGPPVVAITGQGGIGKTALAVHVAHTVSYRFPDGQLFVDLGGSSRPQEPAVVLGRILRSLGVEGRTFAAADVQERAALFRSMVAGLHLLILLDNAANERQVRPLLPGSGESATVVTSRNRLVALESATGFELRLFAADEARALLESVVSASRIRAETSATDDIICSCGGLPLAVRIAGARLAATPDASVASVARQLHDEQQRLDRLSVGDLEVRTSIRLGYDALLAEDRRALRDLSMMNLSTFSAWTLAPLARADATEASVIAERLAGHRLLETVGTDPGGGPRYRLHDLVRLFASERSLRQDSEQDRRDALQRALGFWLVTAEAITDALPATPYAATSVDLPRWTPDDVYLRDLRAAPRDWFLTERRSLSGAVRSALAHGLPRWGWQIAAAMSSPCILYSDYDLLREVATLSRDACHDTGDIQGTAAMISVLAHVEMDLCEWGSSKTLYTTAYELFAEAGDLLGEAFAATFAADSARMIFQYDKKCDLDEVRLWSHRAAALCEKVDDPYRKTDVAYVLGKFFLATGELDRAREQFEAVLHQASALGKPVSQAHALFRLGNVAQRTGQWSHALTAYHRALQICKEVGHRLGVGYITLALAELHAERAERREALNYARTALSTFRELQLRKKADETYLLLKKLTLRWP